MFRNRNCIATCRPDDLDTMLGCCIDVDIVDACAMLGDNAQRFPCCDSTGTKLPHSRHDPNRVVLFEEVSEYLLRWIGGV